MSTNGWARQTCTPRQRRSLGLAPGGPARRARTSSHLRRAALLALLLGAPACLDVVGNVELASQESLGLRPTKAAGADAGACSDAGVTSGACSIGCSPGQGRCRGALLQRCNTEGNGWEPAEQCASSALCDPNEDSCLTPACSSGQHVCTASGELLVCASDRTGFEHEAQCQSGAYCSAVSGREGCEGIACRAGRQRCNGAQIEQCRNDRLGFDLVGEPCASAALCREGESDLARCEAPVCPKGEFTCDGARLMRCSDEATALIEIRSCPSAALCNAAEQRCDPPTCSLGQQRCNGNVLTRCNAAQTEFVPVETCGSVLLCDPSAAGCLTAPPEPPVLGDAPYTFVSASGGSALGLGPLSLTLPAEWADVDRRPWTNARGETQGPQVIASTNAVRFASSFDIPGVLFTATPLQPIAVAARLNEFDLAARCTRGAAVEYDDGLYFGTSQTWTDCAGTNATVVVTAAVPENEAFVAIVVVSMLAERDQDARRRIWDTFLVQPLAP